MWLAISTIARERRNTASTRSTSCATENGFAT